MTALRLFLAYRRHGLGVMLAIKLVREWRQRQRRFA
jgi:hypothetical protein